MEWLRVLTEYKLIKNAQNRLSQNKAELLWSWVNCAPDTGVNIAPDLNLLNIDHKSDQSGLGVILRMRA